jgi:peptidyl-prolyl cis-trans isomerase C
MMKRRYSVFIVSIIFMIGIFLFSIQSIAQENLSAEGAVEEVQNIETPVTNEQVVIAEVNGEPVYLAELKEIWDTMPENYRTQFPGGFKDLLEQWIRQVLLVQEAKKLGLADDPDVKKKIENVTQQIMIQEFVTREIIEKAVVSDEEIEKEYSSNPTLYTEAEQVKARHIMVNTKEEADVVQKELKEGKPFEQVAKEKSQSPDAQTGGEMGMIRKGDLEPEMEKVLFDLAPGNVSESIETDYGIHVFLVEDHLQPRLKDLAEVKEEIRTKLLPKVQQEAFEKMIEAMKNKSEIAILEENLPKEEIPEAPATDTNPETATPPAE